MTLTRQIAGLALAALACATAAHGNELPDGPIRIVVPFAPGGPTDTSARLVAAQMAQAAKVPFIVENIPGAGGVIGTARVADSKPDGTTLLWGSVGPLAISPHLNKNMTYDPTTAFDAIGLVASQPFVLAVNAGLGVTSVQELVELARKSPGRLNFASAGIGHTTHLLGELFAKEAGVSVVHVPYKSGSAALQAVMAGEADFAFDPPTTVVQAEKTGKVGILAITSAQRSAELPQIPTLIETKLPGVRGETWFGLVAPAGTPKPTIQALARSLNEALKAPDTAATLKSAGFVIDPLAPAEFQQKIARDNQTWGDIIQQSNITIQ